MQAIKCKNTSPELAVRKALHAMGFRFRLHRKSLPGRPDVVLIRERVAIYVHGCFWHQHSGCPKARLPKTNGEYWGKKLAGNALRDQRNLSDLQGLGWRSLVVWECQTKDPIPLRRILEEFVATLGHTA